MRRSNTWANAAATGEAEIDLGGGLTVRLPLGAGVPTRLNAIEGKQAVRSVRLESGQWVWDLVGGTHYAIPDHEGSLVVRAKPWPTPATTPALDW